VTPDQNEHEARTRENDEKRSFFFIASEENVCALDCVLTDSILFRR
jgi:hypothetical protein